MMIAKINPKRLNKKRLFFLRLVIQTKERVMRAIITYMIVRYIASPTLATVINFTNAGASKSVQQVYK